jgi:hypothetical protein
MSFKFSSLHICLAAAALVLSGVLVGNAQSGGKERGRPIEFSLPKSDEVTTNLHELTSKKDSLKQLEEDLYKPLETFSPKSSLDGVVIPPPRTASAPPIQSKRVKELLERRKNWVFMNPEDLIGAPSADDVFKTPQVGPDGQEKKELPPLVRYYRRLSNKQAELDNPLQFKDRDKNKSEDLFGMPGKSDSRDERVPQEDLMIPGGVRERAQELNKLVDSDRSDSHFSQAATHGDFTDTFGLGNQHLSKEQTQEHKKRMDDYRSMVDPSWHPPVVVTPENLLSTLTADSTSPAGKPAVGLPSALSPAPPSALEAQMDVTSPRLGPAALPDVNSQALGQTRPAPVLPTFEPTRVPPPAPTFAVPKRVFY